ncbi:TatD family hydrolase [Niallia sp.]|uniref:TatD family hydrolase n=1 Tax=Niallia sp. TaxID=2837523 RepID=UPI00289E1172|nr:TatD family hydrolase [Niallia sp.]
MNQIIDAHIHLDQYSRDDIIRFATENTLRSAISVSMNIESCIKTETLSREFDFIKPSYGYHPEQPVPSDASLSDLFTWINKNHNSMTAIGEVGLPHFIRRQNPSSIPIEPYIEMLEQFIVLAKKLEKPVILHCVYDEADLAIHLLEKHSFSNAHFHWFKGSPKTIEQMIANDYYISLTPDLLYKEKTRQLAKQYPIENIMVETDGPWPFEGPYLHQKTVPTMIHDTIYTLSTLKKYKVTDMYDQLLKNTKNFYSI